jgi:NAD(P)-dependent dehydrogenase (short-subunit alcohol dehydrogenase family)
MQSILHPILGPSAPPHPDLTGKTAVVTGGALGIGYEISRALALEGARVIMVNRKEEQGDEAIEKIEKEAKEKGSEVKVEWVGCDLGDLKNVKEVFDGLRERLDRLDLVGGRRPRGTAPTPGSLT